jgi:hypothetical protein
MERRSFYKQAIDQQYDLCAPPSLSERDAANKAPPRQRPSSNDGTSNSLSARHAADVFRRDAA